MKINRYSTLAVSIAICLSSTAYSGGFTVTVQSASSGGTASTNHAMAEDASAMFYNPALLSSIEGTQVNGGISLTSPDMTVTDAGSQNPSAIPFTGIIRSATNGKTTAEPTDLSAAPSMYYKRDISPKMAFGLGLNIPHGVSSEYDKDSFARYEATESALTALNINPALSWKLNDKLDLGAGLNFQYATATLAKSLDSYAVCVSVAGAATCAPRFTQFNDPDRDSTSSVEADSLAVGFNMGGVYKPSDHTTISVGYRSAVKHDLEGDVDFTLDAALTAMGFGATFADQKATAELELPATLSVAFAQKMNSKLTVHGDATWTDWSAVPEIRIVFPDSAAIPDSVTDLKWEDTVRVGAGVTYQMSDKTKLRAGVAYDPTPTPGAENRTPRAPSSDTIWLSVGMGHKFSKKLSLDASLAYIHLEDMKVNYETPGSSNYLTKANVEANAISAALSLNYKFK